MDYDSNLMAAIVAALKAEKSKAPKKAKAPKPSASEEINGIEIVEEERKANKVPKARLTPIEEPKPKPKPKPARAPVEVVEELPAPRSRLDPVRPGKPRGTARPAPHSCNCSLCPLKTN
jgi:hypothetical protein